MHAGQHPDRFARVDRDQKWRHEVHAEIDLAARHLLRVLDARLHWHVAHIGEAFGAQQLLGSVLRRKADARNLRDPDRRGFWRRLLGERCAGAKDTGGRRQRRAGHEIAARLYDLHPGLHCTVPGRRDLRGFLRPSARA
jgi:hypothetical protein